MSYANAKNAKGLPRIRPMLMLLLLLLTVSLGYLVYSNTAGVKRPKERRSDVTLHVKPTIGGSSLSGVIGIIFGLLSLSCIILSAHYLSQIRDILREMQETQKKLVKTSV